MKKLSFIAALLMASATLFAQTELVDWSKVTTDSWGGSGNPEVSMNAGAKTITAVIVGTPGWQWGNQVKITLGNVATAGLDLNKEYQLSFTAAASTVDCSGVTLKWFDNNQLSYSGDNCAETGRVHSTGCLALSTTPLNYASEWIQPEAAATNATIVFDFGWDPAQTVTISNLSLKARAVVSAINNVAVRENVIKSFENGQLVITVDGIRYNAAGQQIK